MDIVRFPDASLFVSCKEVTVFGEELKVLLDSMWETMKAANGIGLAANQVGLTARMLVMEGNAGEKLYIVNPKIVGQSTLLSRFKEGCLSAPGEFIFRGDRFSWVMVEYFNEKGEKQRAMFNQLASVCVQHEIDHLDGKSFMESKSIPRLKRKELAKKWGLKLR